MTEWFEQWFGEEYLRLYTHRDDEEAAHLVALIGRYASFPGQRVLDLACGSGRHAAQFITRGAWILGFDLSMPLLSLAKHRLGTPLALVRGDMRHLPFRSGSFDLVVNLFTSFGYFGRDEQHMAVLQEAAAVLRQGGIFVLDYLNATAVRNHLVPSEVREIGARQIAIEREISPDDRYVIKRIHLVDDGRSFQERVRLFSSEELASMLESAALTVRERLGDYQGTPYTHDSPRAVFVAERR